MVTVSPYGTKDILVPIDQSGRIVLPKNIRQELALKPGDVFKVSIHGAAVTLTPSKESAGFVRKGKALVFSTSGDDTLNKEAVQAVLEEGRAEKSARIKGELTVFVDTSVLIASVLEKHDPESEVLPFSVFACGAKYIN